MKDVKRILFFRSLSLFLRLSFFPYCDILQNFKIYIFRGESDGKSEIGAHLLVNRQFDLFKALFKSNAITKGILI